MNNFNQNVITDYAHDPALVQAMRQRLMTNGFNRPMFPNQPIQGSTPGFISPTQIGTGGPLMTPAGFSSNSMGQQGRPKWPRFVGPQLQNPPNFPNQLPPGI